MCAGDRRGAAHLDLARPTEVREQHAVAAGGGERARREAHGTHCLLCSTACVSTAEAGAAERTATVCALMVWTGRRSGAAKMYTAPLTVDGPVPVSAPPDTCACKCAPARTRAHCDGLVVEEHRAGERLLLASVGRQAAVELVLRERSHLRCACLRAMGREGHTPSCGRTSTA
jgi:hypothetical protein